MWREPPSDPDLGRVAFLAMGGTPEQWAALPEDERNAYRRGANAVGEAVATKIRDLRTNLAEDGRDVCNPRYEDEGEGT